jgi:hypothetical protein
VERTIEGSGGEGHRRGVHAQPYERRWNWRLGFGLAIAYAWVWIGLYFMTLALGAMADCFGAQPCTDLQHQGMVDGNNWGALFAACTVVASGLAVAAAEGIRRAAAALVVFSAAVAVVTYSQPNDDVGMRGTGVMVVVLLPLFVLAASRWWSIGRISLPPTFAQRQPGPADQAPENGARTYHRS